MLKLGSRYDERRVTERSGKKSWVHWRWQCSSFLRQTFVEWAAQTINKSFWAGAYYYQQREKGCTYQAAVRALAFKWIWDGSRNMRLQKEITYCFSTEILFPWSA